MASNIKAVIIIRANDSSLLYSKSYFKKNVHCFKNLRLIKTFNLY